MMKIAGLDLKRPDPARGQTGNQRRAAIENVNPRTFRPYRLLTLSTTMLKGLSGKDFKLLSFRK
jgi:hypothetical protein